MSEEASDPLKEIRDLYSSMEDNLKQLPQAINNLISYSNELVDEVNAMEKKLKESETELKTIKTEFEDSSEIITELRTKNQEYETKLANLEEKMSNFREMYEELAAEKAKDMDIEELLTIYSVLFENVFAANPHTKVLLLLQGTDKEVWTRNEIVKTTGIAPAAVLKVLHDLRNSDIIEMDEDTQEIKLVQKLV